MPRIQLRRGTAAQWASTNPTLAAGEIGVETDTGYMKVGNGTAAWNARPYQQGPAGPSAYQVAVSNGFVGTEAEWLGSLASTVPGPPGDGLRVDDSVPTYSALPASGVSAGAMYVTEDTGKLYIYSGTAWPAEVDGIDLVGPPGTTSWAGITDKPTAFPAEMHTHAWADVTKPAFVAAGATAAAARTAIGAMSDDRIQVVASLPGSPVTGVLYCIPE